MNFKVMEFHSFSRLFLCFLVDGFEDVTKVEFKICFGVRSLNEEQRSIILQTKVFQMTSNFFTTKSFHEILTTK